MSDLAHLIQSGGADVMGLINQGGGAGLPGMIAIVVNVLIPILFFAISKIVHDNLDDSRAEKSDEAGEDRKYVIWGLYSIKVNLFMVLLCYIIGWVFAWVYFKIPIIGSGGIMVKYLWKGIFGFTAITHAWSIVGGGLKSTAYQYFVDELYDDSAKMKDVCVEFGCGSAPHGSQEVVRGADYK